MKYIQLEENIMIFVPEKTDSIDNNKILCCAKGMTNPFEDFGFISKILEVLPSYNICDKIWLFTATCEMDYLSFQTKNYRKFCKLQFGGKTGKIDYPTIKELDYNQLDYEFRDIVSKLRTGGIKMTDVVKKDVVKLGDTVTVGGDTNGMWAVHAIKDGKKFGIETDRSLEDLILYHNLLLDLVKMIARETDKDVTVDGYGYAKLGKDLNMSSKPVSEHQFILDEELDEAEDCDMPIGPCYCAQNEEGEI